MTRLRPEPGTPFPAIEVARLGGGTMTLGTPSDGHDWQAVIVYRGKHCPRCTRYLTNLKDSIAPLSEIGVDVVAVSGDTEAKAQAHLDPIMPNYAVGYGLSPDQMRTLGLYISTPRDAQETDMPFSEPGLFVVNDEGRLHVVDIGNASWTRPDISGLIDGLKFIRGRGIAVRGTH